MFDCWMGASFAWGAAAPWVWPGSGMGAPAARVPAVGGPGHAPSVCFVLPITSPSRFLLFFLFAPAQLHCGRFKHDRIVFFCLRCARGCGILYALLSFGAVAQLVEHHVRNVGVRGSNPLRSTILPRMSPSSGRGFTPRPFGLYTLYGIKGGRISKLFIKERLSQKPVLRYDRGWKMRLQTASAKTLVTAMLAFYKA